MTNEELTRIYNEANGLDPKRHNPITTERIFAAMRAAMAREREACARVCESVRTQYEGTGGWVGAQKCLMGIRVRSNVEVQGRGARLPAERPLERSVGGLGS